MFLKSKVVYLVVFLSLAAWSIFAYITMNELIEQQKIYAKIINLSGKQRMLFQKIALITTRIFLENETHLLSHRNQLIKLMQEEHNFIIHHLTSKQMEQVYFDRRNSLNQKVHAFFELLENPPKEDLKSYVNRIEKESYELLPELNEAVYMFEDEANETTRTLKEREIFILVGTLLTLLIESIFIVFPMIKESERRQKRLDAERKKSKTLLNLSSDALFVMDSESGDLIEYSQMAQKYLGYTDEEMKHLNVLDWDKEFNSLEEYRAITGVIGDKPVIIERIHTRKDGSTYIASESAVRIKIEGKDFFSTAVRDITEQKHDYEERMRQKAQLQAITDSSQDAILMMNPEGNIIFWNPAAKKIFGYTAEEVIGKDLHNLITPKRYLQAFKKGFKKFQKSGTGQAVGTQLDIQALHKDGYEFSVDVAIDAILVDGKWYAMGLVRDTTEKKVAEDIIKRQKNLLEKAQKIAKLGIFEHDLIQDRISWSDEMYIIYEQDKESFIVTPKALLECVHPEDRERLEKVKENALKNKEGYEIEYRLLFGDGEIKWLNVQTGYEYDENGNAVRKIGTVLDITEQKEAEEHIKCQAVTDELTKLYNRKAFNERMTELIAQFQRYGVSFSLLVLDVDHFKSVNDTYGHQAGDQVLIALSEEMNKNVRVTDYLFRIGGEEFSILLTGTTLDHAVIFAEKLRASIQHNVNVIPQREITISIGVAEFRDGDDHDSLVKRADDNLYRAKNAGRNRVEAHS